MVQLQFGYHVSIWIEYGKLSLISNVFEFEDTGEKDAC